MNSTNENRGARGYSQAISDAIEQRRKNPKIFIRDLTAFAIGLLFARCHVVFGARPLSIALLCALPHRVWVALFGCVLGALSLGKGGFIYAMVCFVAVFLRLAISGGIRSSAERRALLEGGLLKLSVAAICGFTVSAYELLLSGINGTSILFGLATVILAPLLSVALSYLFGAKISPEELLLDSNRSLSVSGKRGEELYAAILFRVSAAAYAFFITLSLREFELLGVSLAYVFASAATLVVSKRFGALAGAGIGFAAALAISPTACTAFALSGLAAGALFKIGMPYALTGGGIALFAWSSYSGGIVGLLSALPEYIIGATLCYPLLGKIGTVKVEEKTVEQNTSKDMVGTMALAYKNKYVGVGASLPDALYELAGLICAFSESMEKRSEQDIEGIILKCQNELSSAHSNNADAYLLATSVNESIAEISGLLIDGKRLLADDLRKICKLNLSDSVILRFCELINAELASLDEDIAKRRSALRSEDFSSIAAIISAAARSDELERGQDCSHDEALSEIFERCGFIGGTIRAFGDRYKHIIAAGEDSDGLKITSAELKSGIEGVLGVKLAPAEFYRRGSLVLMEATAKRSYSASYGMASKDGKVGEISGDSVSAFESHDDRFFSLICDGMGSGEVAKRTSSFASDFLKGLLSRGCDSDGGLHILNSLIRAKGEECSATVDLFELDLMSCEARFIKCGAASSYVKRDSSIFRIRSRTTPIGLLRGIDAERIRVEVRPGDFIIMLSDGVCQGADDAPWLLELLSKYNGHRPAELAEKILSAVPSRSSGDDMSVIAIKISAE